MPKSPTGICHAVTTTTVSPVALARLSPVSRAHFASSLPSVAITVTMAFSYHARPDSRVSRFRPDVAATLESMLLEIGNDWRRVGIAAAALALAFILSRLSRRLAEWVSARLERRRAGRGGGCGAGGGGGGAAGGAPPADTAAMVSLKRYDTTVSLVHTTIR